MKINIRYFILFFLLFAVLGYYREKFFVTLNHLMFIKYYGHNNDGPPLDSFIHFLDQYDYQTLYYSKYPLTVLSILLFGALSLFAVRFILGTKKLWRWVVYSYLILLTLAGISMLFGFIVNQRLQDDEYTLSRWLVGIIQSPIITIIIIAGHQLLTHQNPKEK